MEWITVIVCALGIVGVLLAVFALMGKRHPGSPVPGHFDFDRYKASELSRRGLFDKTKWR